MNITATIVRTVDKYTSTHTRHHSTYSETLTHNETIVNSYALKVHGYRRKEVQYMIDTIISTCDIYVSDGIKKVDDCDYHCICGAYTDLLLLLGFTTLGINNNTEKWVLVDRQNATVYALLAKGSDLWNMNSVREFCVHSPLK